MKLEMLQYYIYFYCIYYCNYSLNGSYPHSWTILLHKFLVTDSPCSRLLLCGLRSKGVITTPADNFFGPMPCLEQAQNVQNHNVFLSIWNIYIYNSLISYIFYLGRTKITIIPNSHNFWIFQYCKPYPETGLQIIYISHRFI